MNKLVADEVGSDGLWVKTYGSKGFDYITKAYRLWRSMVSRCDPIGSVQKRSTTYVGCTMSESFKDFQFFAAWCNAQIGYGDMGFELDKDILIQGNKVYSEYVCVFVPSSLNLFLTSCLKTRGPLPQGVSYHKQSGKFHARIRVSGKMKHLGLFSSVTAASNAYKVAKQAEAGRWADRLEANEYLVDKRVIERMRNWAPDLC